MGNCGQYTAAESMAAVTLEQVNRALARLGLVRPADHTEKRHWTIDAGVDFGQSQAIADLATRCRNQPQQSLCGLTFLRPPARSQQSQRQ